MTYENVLIENASKDEAYEVFDRVRKTIIDCDKSVVVVSGNKDNYNSGWSTVKIYFNRYH